MPSYELKIRFEAEDEDEANELAEEASQAFHSIESEVLTDENGRQI